MFISSKTTNKLQDAISRVQENGRFAIEFITQDVRMADYFMECSTADKDPNAIMGTNNDSDSSNLIVNGTDTITVRQTTGPCDSRQVTAITYSIRLGANGQPSLYQTRQVTPVGGATVTDTDELIEGIENMQILYGVDTDPPIVTEDAEEVSGTPNYYVPAVNVVTATTGWDDVVAIRLSLLARSDNNVTSQTLADVYNAYNAANGLTSAPALSADDKRIRRMYSATITLRNRLK